MRALLPFIVLMRHHLGWVLLGGFLSLLTLFSAIGLLALSGWFITATSLAGLTLISAQAFNYYTPGAGVRGFAILRTAGRYGERIATHEATFRLLSDLRCWFYRAIEPLGPRQVAIFRSSDLLNRIVSDIDALDNLYLRVLVPSVMAVITTAFLALFVSFYDTYLAWILVLALFAGGVLLPFLGHSLGKHAGRTQISSKAALRNGWLDLIRGMADLRIYGASQRHSEQLLSQDAQLLGAQVKMSWVNGLTSGLMVMLAGLTMAIVLFMGIERFAIAELSGPQVVMLVLASIAAFEVVAGLPVAYQYLGKTLAAAARLNEVLSSTSDVSYGDAEQGPDSGSVIFNNVSFAYQSTPAINHFSLSVNPGETLAVLGHTGSGKSSLINLLARFWEPQVGHISLNGLAITDYTEEALRRQISVMSQPVKLFSGSVRDNLLLASPQATDEQLWQALEIADLDQFLHQEGGLDHFIGENGQQLSGGQRKRLALARALLYKAPILILDEPLEGLDVESAKKIIQRLLIFCKTQNTTLIMITHHLVHLERFDRIALLDSGELVEEGQYDVLARQSSSRLSELLID